MTPRLLWCCLALLWATTWTGYAQNQTNPFSICWSTDGNDPTANDYNEFGYATHQKADGSFYLWGDTDNRGEFTPPGIPDDLFISANIDANGNPLAPKHYIHSFQEANKQHRDHFLVYMNPAFNIFPNSPYVAITNYWAGPGLGYENIQFTLLNDEADCIDYTFDWGGAPDQGEIVHDAIQAPFNGELVIVGECVDYTATPILRKPFIYGFDLNGNPTGNYKLDFFSTSGNGLAQVKVNAIDERTNLTDLQRFGLTGEVDNRLLFFTANFPLQPSPPVYTSIDIDNNPSTREIGVDIVHDANSDTWLIAGRLLPPITGIPNQQIFLSRVDNNGNQLWARVYDLPYGTEDVEEMHLDPNGNIALTGRSSVPANQAVAPRTDRAYLLKLDANGSPLWAYRYMQSEGNEAQDLEYCQDGGYMLTGSCWKNIPSSPPVIGFAQNHNIWNVRTDAAGRLGPDAEGCLEALDVAVTEHQGQIAQNEIIFEPIEFETTELDYACDPFEEQVDQCIDDPIVSCGTDECPAFPVLNISTGIDAAGTPLPATTVDPYWQTINFPPLDNTPPSGIAPPNAYAITPYSNSTIWNVIPGTPASSPISVRPAAGFGPNNVNTGHPWRIRREFCLCDTSQIQITGNMRADDQGQLFLYNEANPFVPVTGGPIGQTVQGCPQGDTDAFYQDWPINYTGTLPPGTYHLEFEVVNCGNVAMGLAVSATVNNLSGASTISNPADSCCSNGVITVQKLNDLNCNGERDPNEPGLPGWDFTLVENTSGLTYTGTTNAFGEVIFRQLPYGTYTLTETILSPWMASSPAGGTTTVTISPNNPVEIVDFLNKNPEDCNCVSEQIVPINSPVDACCYELIVDNNFGLYYDEIELVANGFTVSLLNNTSGLTPISSTPNSIKISDIIPMGNGQSMFTFCTSDLFGAATATINWYKDGEVVCDKDIELVCDRDPDCYEIISDTLYCDEQIPNLYHWCYRVQNNWVLPNLQIIDFTPPAGVGILPTNPVTLPAPITPGNSSTQVCVQIYDNSGLPLPRTIMLDHAAHDSLYQECCESEKDIALTLPNCCDPCTDDWVQLSPDSLMNDTCCYALDINVTCPLSLTAIRLESLTPGVALSGVFAGGSCAANWNTNIISTQLVEYLPVSGGAAPVGFCDDLVNFCIQDSLGNPFQEVAVHYIMPNGTGGDSIACSDTLRLECQMAPPCLEIVSDSVFCDANGAYWLSFCVKNVSVPAFDADELAITVLPPNPAFLYVTPNKLNVSGLLDAGDTYCGQVQIGGVPSISPVAGQKLVVGFAMHDNDPIPMDTCCIEDEELCVILPPCDDCCTDEAYFFQQVIPATSVTSINPLTAEVDNPLVDDCHQVTIYWGDGSQDGPFAGNQLPIQHSYTPPPSSNQVCVFIEELNDDGTICWSGEYCDIVGEDPTLSINIYPNPTTGQVQVINRQSQSISKIRLLDLNGKLLLSQDAYSNKALVDLSPLQPGMYWIETTDENGQRSINRVVKE